MKTINIHKAEGIGGTKPESVTIVIDKDFPDFENWRLSPHLHKKEGEILAEALLETLPGGTTDQLTIELLKAKASYLVIPFGK